jgi:hypothetical protein
MPSLVLCTGFEHGLNTSASWIKCNTGVKYADAIDGTGPQILSSGAVLSRYVSGGRDQLRRRIGRAKYANPGGLVLAGRDNYQGQAFKDVSAAGGTVLIYLDAVIDNRYGRYHEMLNKASECGSRRLVGRATTKRTRGAT